MKVKRSITQRLFISVTSIVLVFTLVLLLANSLLLKPLYLRTIEGNIVSALTDIAAVDGGEITDDWLDDIRLLSIGNDFDTVVVLQDQVIYSASPEVGIQDTNDPLDKIDARDRPERNRLPFDAESARIEISDGIERVTSIDPNPDDNNTMLVYGRQMDDDLYIYMFQPLEPVNESVYVANQLLLICALVFLIAMVFFTLRLARKFTKPIKEIEEQVDAMNRFEFGQSVAIHTGDELEALGNEVNQLSVTLERSLDQLNQQNKQLAKDVKSQKKFISNASHELRTPLALIKGYSEEITAGYVKNDQQQKKYMTYIAEEATKMSRLLDEILELSRLESGRMSLQEGPLNIRETIQGFIDKYEGFVLDEQLKVSVEVSPDLIGVFDVVRFEQILANFISNAAKYGDADKVINIGAVEEDGIITVTVFNSGKHIGQEVMDHLWDGFYMADEARSSKLNSYGLGLSIVKAIQEVGNKNYGAKNVEGGVAFWIEMSVAK